MHSLYNIVLYISDLFVRYCVPLFASSHTKLGKFAKRQKEIHERLDQLVSIPTSSQVLWIHASSYGEYNIARPIIQHFKEEGTWTIVLTFFSPTGIDILQTHPEVDEMLPMPLDTKTNVKRFIDQIQPQKALFMVSEFWVNYLSELRKRQIPTYLVSSHLSGREPFFRWYGGLFQEALTSFKHIFVLDESSRDRFAQIGITQVTVTGDSLFDNVVSRASTDYHNVIVEQFVGKYDVFICGSLHHDKDLQLVISLANRHPETRFIIVPHEISEEILYDIIRKLEGHARLYSECTEQTDFSTTQTLIIDFMGALAYLYRYARWAYVGGGFTSYLHNVLEATVYGLPVAFGPQIERKVVAQEMSVCGIGRVVKSADELDDWFTALQHDESRMSQIRQQAAAYMRQRLNSTEKVCSIIGQA